MNSTYDNIGKSKNINLSLFLNWNMSPKTRFNINGRGAYVDYRSSGLDLKNHGWEGNLFGSFQQTLPWGPASESEWRGWYSAYLFAR